VTGKAGFLLQNDRSQVVNKGSEAARFESYYPAWENFFPKRAASLPG